MKTFMGLLGLTTAIIYLVGIGYIVYAVCVDDFHTGVTGFLIFMGASVLAAICNPYFDAKEKEERHKEIIDAINKKNEEK